jgi:hypothetical protein
MNNSLHQPYTFILITCDILKAGGVIKPLKVSFLFSPVEVITDSFRLSVCALCTSWHKAKNSNGMSPFPLSFFFKITHPLVQLWIFLYLLQQFYHLKMQFEGIKLQFEIIKLMYRLADNSGPVTFTVSALEWVYATNLSRLQRETSRRHVGEAHSVLTTVILLTQRLSCYFGKIVSLRMLANLKLSDSHHCATENHRPRSVVRPIILRS